jgi:uncharacterized repeat protein (TIGR03803 family)
MKTILRFFAALVGFGALELHAGNLRVNLAPSSAVSAGAQWRVDGGAWRNSGTTASGLSNTNHTVDYKTVSGWVTPASTTVAVTSGTTTITGTYVQTAALKITLTPSSGQWRIDGGTWRASAATVTGLTPGSHTIDYSSVIGYAPLSTESVTLTSGQTTTLARSYLQLANLTVTLTPSTAQWRVDSGAWQASGVTVSNLSVGAHTVDYAPLNGYSAPASESVTLASGQSLPLSRSYTPLAQLTITLAGSVGTWRIDGGAWLSSGTTASNLAPGTHAITYSAVNGYAAPAAESVTLTSGQSLSLSRSYTALAQLALTLTPGSAQWRVDAGAWLASGVTVSNLAPGSHTIDYSAAAGYITPASETVTLTSGQSASLTRAYVQLAQLTVTLTPSQAQWRVDAGAWQASGATVANLTPGGHTVEYGALTSYAAPSTETVTLTAGQSLPLSRSYTQLAQILIGLVPSSGQWRANGGVWQASGTSLMVLPGSYTIEYATLSLYDSPATETISLGAGGAFATTRYYTSQKPTLRVNLSPATGQWRLDGGSWQSSGADLTELATGSHTLDFTDIGGDYLPLASETISLALREHATLSRSYSLKPASLAIALTPSGAQWRVDNGAWQSTTTTLNNLTPGNHTIDFDAYPGYITPASETVTLVVGANTLSRTYTQLASLSVALSPSGAQWRLDGGQWQSTSTTLNNLSLGAHTLEFSDYIGYITPASETITLLSGSNTVSRSYIQLASFHVDLTPAGAQWRLDGGQWQTTTTTLNGLSLGAHTLEFSDYIGYITPASETVTLLSGSNTASRSYIQLASFHVDLTPSGAQWRLDGGQWQSTTTTLTSLSLGSHLVEFSDYIGYITPPSETVTLVSGSNPTLTRSYTQLASFHVDLTPSGAQWRLDGGPWHTTTTTLNGLTLGSHLVEFSDYLGYITPPSETVTLVSGSNPTLTRSYTQLASFHVDLTPNGAQWRIDGGPWQFTTATLNNLPLGNHLVEFNDYLGYITPPSETVTLVSGSNPTLTRSYTQLASFHVDLTPNGAQWRLDGGPWQFTTATLNNLPLGNHLVEFNDYLGYITPPSETVTLVSGSNPTLTRSYTQLASFHVDLTPNGAQWRLDGGPWQFTTATLNNLPLGNHLVEFNEYLGYITPPSETVTLVSGSNPTLTRSYTQLASLNVALTPSAAQWRLDGGQWQFTTATLNNLPLGAHTLEFNDYPGYTTPPAETITLVSGANPLTRSYTGIPAQITITTNPGTGQWRVYPDQTTPSGAWNSSGTTVTGLASGAYVIEYSTLAGFASPTATFVVLAPGESKALTATYQVLSTQISVLLQPATAHWRIDGGAWQAAGTTVNGLVAGNHLLEFSPEAGLVAPPMQAITLNAGDSRNYGFQYTPSAPGLLTIKTTPSTGQWRVDGGAWQVSGATIGGLSAGSHALEYSTLPGYTSSSPTSVWISATEPTRLNYTYDHAYAGVQILMNPTNGRYRVNAWIWSPSGSSTWINTGEAYLFEYEPLAGYVTPQSEYIRRDVGGQSITLNRSYEAVTGASVSLGLSPVHGQWRIYSGTTPSGAWQTGPATVKGLAAGAYTIEYAAITGYGSPTAETVTLSTGQDLLLNRAYTALPGRVILTTTPATAQWRISPAAGPTSETWLASGAPSAPLPPGDYVIEYGYVTDYFLPASETITIGSAEVALLTKTYRHVYDISISLYPYTAQWRVDGGAWLASGDGAWGLTPGSHTITYSDVNGYLTPPPETVTIQPYPQSITLSRTYGQLAALTISLYPANAQWRIDGGAWQASEATVTDLAIDTPHTIEYSPVAGYPTPPSETITLVSWQHPYLTRNYNQLAQLTVSLNPTSAQWRVDGGAWRASGATVVNLSTTVVHTVEYSAVAGYTAPATETVALTSGQQQSLSRTYTALAQLTLTLSPGSAQWRVDSGAWQASGATVADLSVGNHTVSYSAVAGYITPASETLTLSAGPQALTRSYLQPAQLSITLTPASGLWRIDGGAWQTSGTTVTINAVNTAHTIDYSAVAGYIAPSSETVTLSSGQQQSFSRTYTALPPAQVAITLTPASGQWRIYATGSSPGTWNASAATVTGLTPGNYTVDYSAVAGYDTLASESLFIGAAESLSFSRTYNLAGSTFATIKSFSDTGGTAVYLLLGSDGMVYGTSNTMGSLGAGQLFRMNTDGSGYTLLKAFTSIPNDGNLPTCILESSDGSLYGTTSGGGGTGSTGTVFKINKDGTGYTILRAFNVTSQGSSATSLSEGSDGILYGTTSGGGSSNGGVLFKLNRNGSGFTVLRVLSASSDGSSPKGLIEGPGNQLFGATGSGGTNSAGTVFKLNKDGSGFTVLKHLGGTDGSAPKSGLLRGSDGLLYGTTSTGGSLNRGAAYRLAPDGTGFTVLRSFVAGATDGGRAEGPLTEGPDGVLYGMLFGGGANSRGTIYKLNKDGSGYATVHDFNGLAEGGIPNRQVVITPGGVVIGANSLGGGDTFGTIFRMNTDGSSFTVLRDLGAPDGSLPLGGLLEGSDGALYGTTYIGGGSAKGALFKVNKDGSAYAVLHRFAATGDVIQPSGTLIEASDGLLYGTAFNGVFRLGKDGSGYTIVHTFGTTGDGSGPLGSVRESSDGLLYGTTSDGGSNSSGIIYRMNKDGSAYTILRHFAGGTADGKYPYAGVVEGLNNTLYGTTSSGGSANFGTLFSIKKDGTAYTVLHHFGGGSADGASSYAALALASDGKLYGTTTAGGPANLGTLFRLNADGSGYTVLKTFAGGTTDGSVPYYSTLTEKNGVLYGTTNAGGSFGGGTLFKLNPNGSGFSIVINLGLSIAEGRLPAATLLKASDGALYGTTAYGGGGGTIFRLQTN